MKAFKIIREDLAKELGFDSYQALIACNRGTSIHMVNDVAMKLYLESVQADNYQKRVNSWMLECFNEQIAADIPERNHRFFEESLELVQSLGCSKEEVLMLVDYVYNRPLGEPSQEVGGVMVTLAALCTAANLNMQQDGETEIYRIWMNIEQIRLKQATKPKSSPLPQLQ